MSKDNKKKKKKVKYIDDGRQIADMSSLGGKRKANINERGCSAQWQTYVRAVRSMMIPMLVTMGCICVVFLVLYLLFELAA